MGTTYMIIDQLISLAVVLQAAVVAWAMFTVFQTAPAGGALDNAPTGAGLHGIIGINVIPALALALVLGARLARASRKWAPLVLGAVIVQVLLAFASHEMAWVGLLHEALAFGIMGLADVGARSPPNAPERSTAHYRKKRPAR